MTTCARLVEMGEDLSSRDRARRLREELVREAGRDAQRLTFDFEGVRTLSDSFADELLAVLVEERGAEWFRQRVSLVNLSTDQRLIVLNAIDARLSRRGSAGSAAGAPA